MAVVLELLEYLIPWTVQKILLACCPNVPFLHNFRWFTTLLLADKFGIFSYWRVDIMSGAGDNNNEDSYI